MKEAVAEAKKRMAELQAQVSSIASMSTMVGMIGACFTAGQDQC